MPFDSIDPAEIEVGKPIKKSLLQKIKDSLDDHETRITQNNTSLSGSAPIVMALQGEYATTYDGDRAQILSTRVASDITITKISLVCISAGVSGTTEIDILTNTKAPPAFTSVFTSNPSIGFGSGNGAVAVGALDSGNTNVDAGDVIALTLVSAQAEAKDLYALIEYSYR